MRVLFTYYKAPGGKCLPQQRLGSSFHSHPCVKLFHFCGSRGGFLGWLKPRVEPGQSAAEEGRRKMRTVSSGLVFSLVLPLLLFFPPFFIAGSLAVPVSIPAARVGTGPREQLSVVMAQLGSCSSSQSLLCSLYVTRLCPAASEFDVQAACGLKSPSTTSSKVRLVRVGTAPLHQK